MSDFPTRVRLGWSDMKPAETFLLFAAGITLGVLLTTVCMVDFSTFSKQETADVQAPSSEHQGTPTPAGQLSETTENTAESDVRTDLALQPKE